MIPKLIGYRPFKWNNEYSCEIAISSKHKCLSLSQVLVEKGTKLDFLLMVKKEDQVATNWLLDKSKTENIMFKMSGVTGLACLVTVLFYSSRKTTTKHQEKAILTSYGWL